MSRDYSVNDELERWYLHNLVAKDALRFYSSAMKPYVETFYIASEAIAAQYDSPIRQAQVLKYPDCLGLDKFNKTGIKKSEVLA